MKPCGVDETGWQNQGTPDIGRLINSSPFISQIRDKIGGGGMTCPHSKGSWFILVKIALNQTCKITLKLIFNKKISKKNYCLKRYIWGLLFPLHQKRPPLVLVEERWQPGIEMRFRRESSKCFQKEHSLCFFCFLHFEYCWPPSLKQNIASLMWLKNTAK